MSLDADFQLLHDNAPAWASTRPGEIAGLLRACLARLVEVAPGWVADSIRAKKVAADSPRTAEEWLSGPWAVGAAMNGLVHTLDAFEAGADPLAGLPVRYLPDGRLAVGIFPANRWDALMLHGHTGEAWMEAGVTRETVRSTMGSRFAALPSPPQVAVVLGAGNINSIPVGDALTMLVEHGAATLLKLNPVNAYLKPHIERLLGPLVDRGVLRVVDGGAEVGAAACTHPLAGRLHITGSRRSFDAIVFGTGEDGARRKAADEPLNERPITAELGGVGPAIVVPGAWTPADFRYQAENLVTQKLFNAGCNCISPQVLVVPAAWDGTERLLGEMKRVIRELPPREPWYPGTDRRRATFLEAYPRAERLGEHVLWLDDLDAGDAELAWQEEAFDQIYAVARLPGADAASFLDAAVDFANDRLAGTLGSQLVVDSATRSALGPRLDAAIDRLHYGNVAVNVWSGANFLFANARWGAAPGHRRNDVQSGLGVAHNALMFERATKTVVWAPFQEFPRTLFRLQPHLSPKPIWYVTHRNAARAAELIVKVEATRDVTALPGLFFAALRP